MMKTRETLQQSAAETEAHEPPARTSFWKLTLGSIGVVYGDIGTSPLYAFREAAKAAASGGVVDREIVHHAAARSEEHTSELQSLTNLVCRLLLEKKKTQTTYRGILRSKRAAIGAGIWDTHSIISELSDGHQLFPGKTEIETRYRIL